MIKRKYPRVAGLNGKPRALTMEEKKEFDSLVYKYGMKEGSKLFLEDYPVYFCSIETEIERQKKHENEKALIEFYLKPENKEERKKDSVRKLFERNGLKKDGTPFVNKVHKKSSFIK